MTDVSGWLLSTFCINVRIVSSNLEDQHCECWDYWSFILELSLLNVQSVDVM